MIKIHAKIIADSVDIRGHRITSYILTYPRMIHAEVMTHRMFSRNAASSRALPFKKMVDLVENEPFIPIAWQKDHKGMQGVEYFTDSKEIERIERTWLHAASTASFNAKTLNNYFDHGEPKVTKQLCNRLLEPFQWYTCLVTATEYDNFFELRCPKYFSEDTKKTYRSKKDYIEDHKLDFSPFNDIQWLEISKSGAEIHIQALAEAMWDAKNESQPKLRTAGQWHIPFHEKMDFAELNYLTNWMNNGESREEATMNLAIKIATARCARLSYLTFDGVIDYERDLDLFNMLFESKHMSPFEHCARAMTDTEYSQFDKAAPRLNPDGKFNPYFVDIQVGWCNNFRGFIPYRYIIENTK